MNKLTIKQLLEDKEILEKETIGEKTKDLEVKRLNASITIKSIDIEKLQEFQRTAQANPFKANMKVVYTALVEPNLKDKDLLEKYKCKTDPYGIVKKIFKPNEINIIADKVCELSGMDSSKPETIISEIKNE